MQTLFYVSRKGQTAGPWSIEEIAGRIARAELSATDFLFDDAEAAWIPFLESKQLIDAIKARAPSAPPPAAPQGAKPSAPPPAAIHDLESAPLSPVGDAANAVAEWHVKRAARTYGPFTFLGLVRALQEKSVFEFDLIRRGPESSAGSKNADEQWERIAERPEFQPEAIRQLLTAPELAAEAFLQRRFARRPIEQDALVHDNNKAWIGRTFEGSEGGCGIIVRNALLAPGQVVQIHFGRAEGLPPFNAVCEVVRKRFVREVRDARTPVEYGIKFLQADPRAIRAAREYFLLKQVKGRISNGLIYEDGRRLQARRHRDHADGRLWRSAHRRESESSVL